MTGQQIVAPNALQQVVTFVTPLPTINYGVGITPNWMTGWRVSAKTVNGFTVEFSTPPDIQASIDWRVESV